MPLHGAKIAGDPDAQAYKAFSASQCRFVRARPGQVTVGDLNAAIAEALAGLMLPVTGPGRREAAAPFDSAALVAHVAPVREAMFLDVWGASEQCLRPGGAGAAPGLRAKAGAQPPSGMVRSWVDCAERLVAEVPRFHGAGEYSWRRGGAGGPEPRRIVSTGSVLLARGSTAHAEGASARNVALRAVQQPSWVPVQPLVLTTSPAPVLNATNPDRLQCKRILFAWAMWIAWYAAQR